MLVGLDKFLKCPTENRFLCRPGFFKRCSMFLLSVAILKTANIIAESSVTIWDKPKNP